MKIQGPNRPQINPYLEQQQKIKKTEQKQTKDQLEISETAKKLQKHDQTIEKRQTYVQDIKQQIKSGDYNINYGKTSQKLIDFFTMK